ncbi:hypothetical protein [Kingella potus]|uniref:hypothetical protein n=2 Tax=Kingella potus TaxID=265175 RepID=UPI0011C04C4C|nr:hypothetical protein [Kingella potus]UOP01526.1 hypothetical protein LVJ84_04860 [Kingella potus]
MRRLGDTPYLNPVRRVCGAATHAFLPSRGRLKIFAPQQTCSLSCARAGEGWGGGGGLQNRFVRRPANIGQAAKAPTLTLPRKRRREEKQRPSERPRASP